MQVQTLKGFRDHLPADMAPRQRMIRTIEAVFERHGFAPLQTPALEYAETLTGKYGDEGDKLLYRFTDHGERQVAMRYDLTVPLARVVAQHRGVLAMPLRRYQVAPVWRADKPQRGRYREFVQCDADICGTDSALADAEVLIAGLAVLRELGVAAARLHLNHREILFGVLRLHGVVAPAAQIACIRAIDKLDKMPAAVVQTEIEAQAGLDAASASAVIAAFHAATTVAQWTARAEAAGDAVFCGALGRVQAVLDLCSAAGYSDAIVFDPAIARGLDYYTGIIYETRLTDAKVAGMGAVMSGGRYDNLIGLFAGTAIPAVGISVGLDRLFAALQELALIASDEAAVPVYATVMAPELAAPTLLLVGKLRLAGLRVEMDLAGGKLGKQFERASKRGARAVLVVGSDEAAAGTVVVKDLRAGSQTTVAQADVAGCLRALLAT